MRVTEYPRRVITDQDSVTDDQSCQVIPQMSQYARETSNPYSTNSKHSAIDVQDGKRFLQRKSEVFMPCYPVRLLHFIFTMYPAETP